MNRLEKYIVNNISILFLSIFFALFSIASVIFMIKLATWTAVIHLTLLEMFKMYLFIVPELLFFVMPITFFVSASLALFQLSTDNEMVVIFALSIAPRFLLKVLSKLAFLLSLLLLFDYLFIFPHTRILADNYYDYKKSEAKFNLSASEFGHKFGDWLLYLGKKDKNGTYEDIFLFNKNNKEEILVAAKSAEIINDEGILRLKLKDGEGNTYSKESFSQINFSNMFINDTMRISQREYTNFIGYWLSDDKKKLKRAMLITNTLIALFPIMSVFLIVGIGVVHARHQKARVYLYLFLSIILFFGLTLGLQKTFIYYTIPMVMVFWVTTTYLFYRKTIVKRF